MTPEPSPATPANADYWLKPYIDAGHDTESLFKLPHYKCSKCGAHQINLSEDLVYGPMRRCKDSESAPADWSGEAKRSWEEQTGQPADQMPNLADADLVEQIDIDAAWRALRIAYDDCLGIDDMIAFLASHRGAAATEFQSLRAQLEEARGKLKELKYDIKTKDEALRRKNVALDALGYVWCDGGCKGGTGRFTEFDLTQEHIDAIDRNLKRAKTWLANKNFRAARAARALKEEHDNG